MESNKQNLSTFRSWIMGYYIDHRYLKGDWDKLVKLTNEDTATAKEFADGVMRFGQIMDVFVKDETTP